MRMISLFVLLSLLIVIILSPISINLSVSDKCACIVSLDVCHASAAVSVNSQMPVIDERPCTMCHAELGGFVGISDHSPRPDLFSSKIERPPRS